MPAYLSFSNRLKVNTLLRITQSSNHTLFSEIQISKMQHVLARFARTIVQTNMTMNNRYNSQHRLRAHLKVSATLREVTMFGVCILHTTSFIFIQFSGHINTP